MLQSLHFNTAAYLLPIPIILFLVLAVVGCTSISPGVPNIYLVAITNNAHFSRVGYYGLCSNTSGSLVCSSTVGLSAEDASAKLSLSIDTVKMLYTLQSKVFLPLVAVAGVIFLISNVTLGIYKRSEKRLSTKTVSTKSMTTTRILSLFTAWTSAALLLAAAWSVTLSTAALQVTFQDGLSYTSLKVGISLQALQWVASILTCAYALGVGSMLRQSGSNVLRGQSAVGGSPQYF